MLAVDPQEGVIQWEQWMHSHSDDSPTAADLDGSGNREVVNVGYKLLSGWEPALDEHKTSHEEGERRARRVLDADAWLPVPGAVRSVPAAGRDPGPVPAPLGPSTCSCSPADAPDF